MYRVLIADDESRERNILKILLKRHFPEQFIVHEANNGEEALAQFYEKQPQLMLVDIRMPGINGIDVIKKIRKQATNTYIVIITAYNYFEFAKEAIQEGVNDFILKPPSRENIKKTIEKFLSFVELQEVKERNIKEANEKLNQWKEAIKKELTMSIIYRETQKEKLNYYLKLLEIDYHWGFCLLFRMEYKNDAIHLQQEKHMEKTCDAIGKYISESSKQYTIDVLGKYIILFLFLKSEKQEVCKRETLTMSDEICKHIEENHKIHLKVSIGKGFQYSYELSKSYEEALVTAKVTEGLIGNNNPTIDNRIMQSKEIELEDYSKLIIKKIRKGNEKEVFDTVTEIITILHKIHNEDKDFLKIRLIELLSSVTKSCIDKKHVSTYLNDISNLLAIKDYNKLIKFSHTFMEKLLDYVKANYNKKSHFIIDRVVEYVNENYNSTISIEEVASRFSLNPFYFSKLFKEYQKNNFVDYLTEVRINKAVELLKEESLNIKEIAYEVGYQDPNYFSRVFKKIVGISPKDYRNRFLV